jgi:rSAM/selenodomain-associated transferase 2
MRLSIIVPVLNEAATLRRFLQHLREFAPAAEIIVVDGGSEDASCEIARLFADEFAQSARGRAQQMNAGAKLACGDVFWFVHADSEIAQGAAQAIEKTLADPKIVGGCFRLQIASARWIYRVRDAIGNFLVDLFGIALGDRGLFCRGEAFFQAGGYPEIPILEDAEFYRSLKRCGRVVQLREKIRTSPHRYEALGPISTMLFYTLIMLLYVARVPIRVLEKMVSLYAIKRRSLAVKIDDYCTSTSIGSK